MKYPIFLCFFIGVKGYCQNIPTSLSARSMGMGGITSIQGDEHAIFNNVAGMAYITDSRIGFSVVSRAALRSTNTSGLAMVTTVFGGNAGIGIFHFGDNLYNQNQLSFGYARKIGISAVGIKMNYIQIQADGFGTSGMLGVSGGVMTDLTPALRIGVYMNNITQTRKSEQPKSAPEFVAGFGFKLSSSLTTSIEVGKNTNYHDANPRAGVEYKYKDKFHFRTGFSLYPDAGMLGVGFSPRKVTIDYAFRFEPNLGSMHQTSIIYRPKTTKP